METKCCKEIALYRLNLCAPHIRITEYFKHNEIFYVFFDVIVDAITHLSASCSISEPTKGHLAEKKRGMGIICSIPVAAAAAASSSQITEPNNK